MMDLGVLSESNVKARQLDVKDVRIYIREKVSVWLVEDLFGKE